jgi:hypothetical protein
VKKLGIVIGVLAGLGGAGFAWWKLRPASQVEVKATEKELKKKDGFPHELWTEVLKKHAKDGRVRYAALKADPAALNEYLGYVAKYSPDAAPDLFPAREDKLAYALNAYNAYIVRAVVDHYPVRSVKDIGTIPFDVFKKLEFPFGGRFSSLEEWETAIRETYKDPRIHFALNCASLGCPRLPGEAFEPDDLGDQLERETKIFLGEERNVKVEGNAVKLSSIFKWYRKDFEEARTAAGKADGLEGWLRDNGVKVPEGAALQFVDYDWGLNDLGQ